jgi:predicted permease
MLVEALVLRELPVREPNRLVYLALPPSDPSQTRESISFSYPLFERFLTASAGRVDLVLVGYQAQRRAVFHDAPGRDDRVHPQYVSGNFFATLSVAPARGRVLTAADDRREAPARAAVLSHAFWQRRFGGDPSVVGRVFTLDREFQYEIVGVAREGFTGVEPGILTDFWIPATTARPDALTSPGQHWFSTWGRLGPGVTAEEVQQRFQPVLAQFRRERAATFPADTPADARARYISQPLVARSAAAGPSFLRREFERPLWVLAGIVALVLLLASSNVANLLLARAAAREREMALRLSIGAGRRRLVQQLLIESSLLASAASALGAVIALVGAPLIVEWLAPENAPVHLDLAFDFRVAGFLVLLAAIVTVLFGLVPALRASGASPIDALKATSGRHAAQARLQHPLVAVQVAFSLTVVFLAGLLLLSFQRLVHTDLGFVPDGVVLAEVEAANRVDPQAGKRAVVDLLSRVRSLPGVTSASVSAWPLLKGWGWNGPIRLPGQRIDNRNVSFLEVSPGFLQTMGIALRAGRDFTGQDVEPDEPGVVIVNETFARAFFPGNPPIGRRFERLADGNAVVAQEVVGVVGDVKHRGLRDEAPLTVYVPLRGRRGATVQLKTEMPLEAVASLLRAEAARSNPALIVAEVARQSSLVENGRLRERLLALLSGFFALVSLALAAIGLYGVLSYAVVQRTREIGIRLALGARRRAVVRQVLRDVAVYAAIGIAGGVGGGLYGARFVKTLLFEVEPMSPVSLLLPIAGLLVVATLAAVLPARRAASVDPMVALRDE